MDGGKAAQVGRDQRKLPSRNAKVVSLAPSDVPDSLTSWAERYQALAVRGVRSGEVAGKIGLHLDRFLGFFADAYGHDRAIVATAVVAVAFQPAGERLTRLANRVVYGRRATPYEVLSRFSAQVGETVATEQTLGHMARLLSEGTGTARAQVWLKVGEQMRSAASWPEEAVPDFAPLVKADGSLPEFAEVDLAVPVSHDGQLLGALTITKKRGEPVSPFERGLIEDLAAQAGLVLRNVGLTADLRARLEELRDSRRPLVEAQDQERRRLERDLHDGAQQQLIAEAPSQAG